MMIFVFCNAFCLLNIFGYLYLVNVNSFYANICEGYNLSCVRFSTNQTKYPKIGI